MHLSALTVQNEPLQNDKDYPSMKVQPPQEGEIIEALHKVFAEQGSKVVKALPPVWCFDHNWKTKRNVSGCNGSTKYKICCQIISEPAVRLEFGWPWPQFADTVMT